MILSAIKKEYISSINSTLFNKLFSINLLIWLFAIPLKNSFYQISTILFSVFFITYIYLHNITVKTLIDFFKIYSDVLIAFFLILASMFISTILSEYSSLKDISYILKYFLRYISVCMVLIYFYSQEVFSKNKFIIFIFISLIFYAFCGLYELLMISKFNYRIEGILNGTGYFGLLMHCGLIMLMILYTRIKNTKNINLITLILLSIFFICLLFSFSRASWISFILFYFIMLYINRKKSILKKYILFSSLLFVILILLFNNQHIVHRFHQLISLYGSHRFEIWQHTLQLIKENTILGYGLIEYKLIGYKNFHSPHNSLLEILFYTGIIGLLSHCYLFFLLIKDIIKSKIYELLAVILSLLLISQFSFSITKDKIFLSIFSIVLFFILSYRIKKNEKKI